MPPPRPPSSPDDSGTARTDTAHPGTSRIDTAAPGGPARTDSIIQAVYEELRALAAFHMRRERPDHSLRPTDLVHEVYLRMAAQELPWANRAQFLCVAARQIRRVLVDHARAHNAGKRGGAGRVRVTLSDLAEGEADFDLLDLNRALDRLDDHSSQDRQIVELKYFGGLTEVEVAEALDMSLRTVRRRWAFARAWLFRELGGAPREAP
jgi:RNA polymerase sigma factor (TIGR02999 family)